MDNKLLKFENERLLDLSYKYFNPYRESYSLILTNGNSKLYIAGKSGIKIINQNTNEIRSLDKEIGLDVSPTVIFADDEKNLWVGSEKGLTRISFASLLKFSKENGLSDDKIISTIQDGRNFYFGHPDGLLTYKIDLKFYRLNFRNQLNYYSKLIKNRDLDIKKISKAGNKIVFLTRN